MCEFFKDVQGLEEYMDKILLSTYAGLPKE